MGLLALLGLFALLSVLPAAPVTAAGGEGRVTATVRVNPLRLTVEAPEEVATGQRFEIRAVVSNWGPAPLKKVQATLYPPEELEPELTVRGNAEKRLGNLQGGMTKKATWRVQAEVPGFYIVLVIASAVDSETGAAVSAQGTVTIAAEGGVLKGSSTPPPPSWGDYPDRTTPPPPTPTATPPPAPTATPPPEPTATPPPPSWGDYPSRTTPPLPPGGDSPGGTVPPPPPLEDEDDRGQDEDDRGRDEDSRGHKPGRG